MNRQAWQIFIVVSVLVGASAVFLLYLQQGQELGRPGVQVEPQPIHDPEGNVVGTNRVALPETVLNYRSRWLPISRLELDWLPPDTTYGRCLYRAPDGFESVATAVLMGRDRTSIHKPQYCLTGQGFTIDQTETVAIRIQEPHPYDLNVKKLTTTKQFTTKSGEKQTLRGLYLYWFVADGQLTSDHNQRMWWMARDLIGEGTLQRWAYVSYLTICRPGLEEAAFERMKELVAASVPKFQLAHGSSVHEKPVAAARAQSE